MEVRSTNNNQIKGIYSNKKKTNEKFGKTQKKLPDLTGGGQYEVFHKKNHAGGFASDSDEYLNAQQLPMIKGGGNIHAQNVADAYTLNNVQGNPTIGMPGVAKNNMKKNMHNSNFN